MNQGPIGKQAFTAQVTHPVTGRGRPWAGDYGEPATTDEKSQS